MASLFIFFVQSVCFAQMHTASSDSLVGKALALKLQSHPVWLSLLHVQADQARIEDPQFLLSKSEKQTSFSPKQELVVTISTLFGKGYNNHIKCRFPARDIWLRSQLGLPKNNYTSCTELYEFIQKAPIDTLSVVYSSENLTSASSMMGHVLFKLSGHTPDNQYKEHAITFYTEVKGINLPKILYDSVVSGKEGYFALSPYQEKHEHYSQGEQRNIWVYDLNLTPEQRQIIQYHLWELRQTKLRYFFHTYNCATFTNIILSLSGNQTMVNQTGWQSPLDTVKVIHKANLVANTSFHPSPKARVRMLMENQSGVMKKQLIKAVKEDNPKYLATKNSETDQFIQVKTLEALSYYLTAEEKIKKNTNISRYINEKKHHLDPNLHIDVSSYKSPTLAPFDSQIYMKLSRSDHNEQLILGFLPASHMLDDDQRQSQHHSQLRIADVAIAISKKKKKIKLSHFDLYAMTTYVPRDDITGGISSSFKLGYKQHKNSLLDEYGATYIEGGAGLSYNIHADMTLALLGYLQLNYAKQLNSLVYPELSLFINGIYDSKIVLQHRYLFESDNTKGFSGKWHETSVKIASSLDESNRVSVGADFVNSPKGSDTELNLMWKRLF